ncbi:MAG: 2'-5' RNA ligase family protein, partial [Desulfovibrionaceae bacterium]|nr:2'-5' RNA ligase family protein [Desulfovibrionaceae bacterium]
NAGIVKSPELAALHERVLDALESVTGPLERRHWTPHVTLGRGHADRKPSREDLAAWMAERDRLPRLRFPLTSFELVQSVLRPVMAEHTVLASYPLI